MFRTIFSLSVFLLTYTSFAQDELGIEISENAELIKALNSAHLIGENVEHNLSVRIYKLDNGTASAGFPSSEVSDNLLVAISAFDEEPEQNLFKIGPFLNPKVISWQVDQEYEKTFVVEHGPYDKRKALRLGVNLQSMRIIE
ncbi:hypothetical protein SAMN06265375_1141 [Muriicola jejuensis]|uniref:Uncharacterized protein n=1 Tax=Muriicola jejuensis TaxID=504488 RepID=A0A6P0UIW0_9FLAO|nr:hypothetical protein [Muriicola jejuensis]NER11769.1 hypothetical protein [Muriicola jejuensis]SMP27521.1 hypothetical protein SAMN06265375_1141 [Muriicola jejuensis]